MPSRYESYTSMDLCHIYPGIRDSCNWCSLPTGNELHAPSLYSLHYILPGFYMRLCHNCSRDPHIGLKWLQLQPTIQGVKEVVHFSPLQKGETIIGFVCSTIAQHVPVLIVHSKVRPHLHLLHSDPYRLHLML